MNEEYLKAAQAKSRELAEARGEKYDVRLFITGVSKRAAQLAKHYRPMVQLSMDDHTPYIDIALREIAEGKVVIMHGDYSAYEAAEKDTVEISSITE